MPLKRFRSLLHPKESLDNEFESEESNQHDAANSSTVCCANDDNVDVCFCDDCFLQRVIPVSGPARRSCPGHSFVRIGMCTICGQSLHNGQDVDDDFEK